MNWVDCQRPIIALAPLADYTDSPFCRICREVAGNKFVIFREMVSSEAIARNSKQTLKMCEFDEIERPIVLQIFGSDVSVMAKTAKIIVDKFKPDGIDINMGCPVPKIAGREPRRSSDLVGTKAGASLMKDHDRAVAIIKAIKAVDLGVPISVKTRLGWSKEDEILEFAPKLEQAGVDLLTIHGRTKTQGYSGKANWEMITKVKKLVSIPVLANGDIQSSEDVKRCLDVTNADGVMIGRGALGNPWIFNYLRNYELLRNYEITKLEDKIEIILKHARLHLEHYGERGMITFRKHLIWYFKSNRMVGIENIKEFRKKLVKIISMRDLKNVLKSCN